MPLNWITFVLLKCKVEKSEALQPRRLQIAFRRKSHRHSRPGTLEIESEIFIFRHSLWLKYKPMPVDLE